MKSSAVERCVGWAHWVKMEKNPPATEERLLMANDIQKLLAVYRAVDDIDLLALPRGKSVITLENALADATMKED